MNKHIKYIEPNKTIINIVPGDVTYTKAGLESLAQFLHTNPKASDRVSINFKKKTINIKETNTISYEICISKNDISFQYIIPHHLETSISNKLKATYKKLKTDIGEDQLKSIDLGLSNISHYYLKEPNFKSLSTDFRENSLLKTLMSVKEILKDNEKVLIQFIIQGLTDEDWQQQAISDYVKDQNGQLVDKGDKVVNGAFRVVENVFDEVFDIMELLLDDGFKTQGKKSTNKSDTDVEKRILKMLDDTTRDSRKASEKKIRSTGYNIDIRAIIQSKSTSRRFMIDKNILNALNELSIGADNSFRSSYYECKEKHEKMLRLRLPKRKDSIYSKSEFAEMLKLPNISMQREYNMTRIEVFNDNIPNALYEGYIRTGVDKTKNGKRNVYFSSKYDDECKPTTQIGSSGGGKTTAMECNIFDAIMAKKPTVVFDFNKNCELTKNVYMNLPDKEKKTVHIIDVVNNPVAMNFIELFNLPDMTNIKVRRREADKIKFLLEDFINSVQKDQTQEMSTRMTSYMFPAIQIVFVYEDGSIYNMYKVLTDHKFRHKQILRVIEDGIFSEEEDAIQSLLTIDIYPSKFTGTPCVATFDKVIGTSTSGFQGVIDRMSPMIASDLMNDMIKSTDNINFFDIIEKGESVFFRMPSNMFATPSQIDLFVSSMMLKLWVTARARGALYTQPSPVHIYIDEVHQCVGAMKALARYIVEVRKYGNAYHFAVQYLDQLNILRDALTATSCHYLIHSGINSDPLLTQIKGLLGEFTVDDYKDKNKFGEWTAIANMLVNNMPTVFKVHTCMLPKRLQNK